LRGRTGAGQSGKVAKGSGIDTAEVAQGTTGEMPDWIFPFIPGADSSTATSDDFQYLMYRPLYWFGTKGAPTINESLSLAKLPVWSDGNKTATIQLKGWKWSNGETVDSQDVLFWMNMMFTEKGNWADYTAGYFPDNVASVKATGPLTVVFHLKRAFSTNWYLYNQLSQITPMPAAWDRTASGPSHCETTPADCPAVYKYLDGLSKDVSTYASNPLWQVVDGPWHLTSFSTVRDTFAPNTKYSGPIKPTLRSFSLQSFTTQQAEFNVLKSSYSITQGSLPTQDLPQQRLLDSRYKLSPDNTWAVAYYWLNFNNPTMGSVFKQLYFRQALQMTVDQKGIVSDVFNGYGRPTYGPVPTYPKTPFVSSAESKGFYHFDVKAAASLLRLHGWKVNPGGIDVCQGNCGPGVAPGTRLSFTMLYDNSTLQAQQEFAILKSDAQKAGINIQLKSEPFSTLLGQVISCKPSQATCTWQAGSTNGWAYAPDYYPTGEELRASGGIANSGSYASAEEDKLISATTTTSSVNALKAYEDYTGKQLPVIWLPQPTQQLSKMSKQFTGLDPQSSLLEIYPEQWWAAAAG